MELKDNFTNTDTLSTEVKPVSVKLFCIDCEKEMKFTGQSLDTNPTQYVHSCKSCTKISYENETYPRIEYIDIE